MIEELAANAYKVCLPLVGSSLKTVNSYIIKGHSRNLVIDTGWNEKECYEAMNCAFNVLGIEPEKTDYFITHCHPDHAGLVYFLKSVTSIIYFNEAESEWLGSDFSWDEYISFGCSHGFPRKELCQAVVKHPGYRYGMPINGKNTSMGHGEKISVGDFVFECIITPGHSELHVCLFERDRRLLFSGDHIIKSIVPSIQLWHESRNPLSDYFASLEEVDKLNVDVVFPGHGAPFRNCSEVIAEIRRHHDNKLDRVIEILKRKPATAYEVASRIRSSGREEESSWEHLSSVNRCFATGESVAMLMYLERLGIAMRNMREAMNVFCLV